MDRGEMWSFLRDVLSTGASIEREEKDSTYERYSARLDRTASHYADKLEAMLKDNTPADQPSTN